MEGGKSEKSKSKKKQGQVGGMRPSLRQSRDETPTIIPTPQGQNASGQKTQSAALEVVIMEPDATVVKKVLSKKDRQAAAKKLPQDLEFLSTNLQRTGYFTQVKANFFSKKMITLAATSNQEQLLPEFSVLR